MTIICGFDEPTTEDEAKSVEFRSSRAIKDAGKKGYALLLNDGQFRDLCGESGGTLLRGPKTRDGQRWAYMHAGIRVFTMKGVSAPFVVDEDTLVHLLTIPALVVRER